MSVSNEHTATSHVVCCAATNSWSGKRHGSQNSLWYIQPPVVIPPSWQTCLVRHTSAGDRRATNLPTDCARLPACGEGVREAFIRLCGIGIVQKLLRRWPAGWLCDCHCTACYSPHTTTIRRVKVFWAIVFSDLGLILICCNTSSFVPVSFNTLRTGSFKLFKRPLPGFLTILTFQTLN